MTNATRETYADIIQQYMVHLSSQSGESKFSERMQFSLWMYKSHPKWVGSIEEIWQEMRGAKRDGRD